MKDHPPEEDREALVVSEVGKSCWQVSNKEIPVWTCLKAKTEVFVAEEIEAVDHRREPEDDEEGADGTPELVVKFLLSSSCHRFTMKHNY